MSKRLIKVIRPYVNLYLDDKTGIAWIEEFSTGMGHSVHPNIDHTGSVKGMRERGYWGKKDKVVRSHGWYYNISKFVASDELDNIVADYCMCEECKQRRGDHSL